MIEFVNVKCVGGTGCRCGVVMVFAVIAMGGLDGVRWNWGVYYTGQNNDEGCWCC